MTLMRVDLPAPFSPTMAWTSPGIRSKETPLSACTPAKDLVMFFNSRRCALTDRALALNGWHGQTCLPVIFVKSEKTRASEYTCPCHPNLPLRQHVALVGFNLVQPICADGHVLPV